MLFRSGFDSLVQMSSGIVAETMRMKKSDAPVSLPMQALDHATGYFLAAAILRALTARATGGNGTAARVSLARTAALLMACRSVGDDSPFAPESVHDVAPDIENTDWGQARRLNLPLTIDGIPMRWDYPARKLGTSPASF